MGIMMLQIVINSNFYKNSIGRCRSLYQIFFATNFYEDIKVDREEHQLYLINKSLKLYASKESKQRKKQ